MDRLEDAVSLYNHYLTEPCIIRNHSVEINYSVHQHLQRNPLDYTPSHILLVTMCGCSKSPFTIFEMADVFFYLFFLSPPDLQQSPPRFKNPPFPAPRGSAGPHPIQLPRRSRRGQAGDPIASLPGARGLPHLRGPVFQAPRPPRQPELQVFLGLHPHALSPALHPVLPVLSALPALPVGPVGPIGACPALLLAGTRLHRRRRSLQRPRSPLPRAQAPPRRLLRALQTRLPPLRRLHPRPNTFPRFYLPMQASPATSTRPPGRRTAAPPSSPPPPRSPVPRFLRFPRLGRIEAGI